MFVCYKRRVYHYVNHSAHGRGLERVSSTDHVKVNKFRVKFCLFTRNKK